MSTENGKLLREIKASIERLSGIVGPIIPTALATLNGWTWRIETLPERMMLTRGRMANIMPSNLIQNEKGWINVLAVGFSDPMSEMIFSCDNWTFRASPFLLNTFGNVLPNNVTTFNGVYNPASVLGPIYTVVWMPSQFWPYNTAVRLQANHPLTAPTATSQVITYALGRHYIRDEKQFYESIFVEGQKQAIGRVVVPIRRNV